jgi:hypothetical protein
MTKEDTFLRELAEHEATVPDEFPSEVPAGTRIAYGSYHGRSFESVAVLKSYKPWQHEVSHHTVYVYWGLIDGQASRADARDIDWRSLGHRTEQPE